MNRRICVVMCSLLFFLEHGCHENNDDGDGRAFHALPNEIFPSNYMKEVPPPALGPINVNISAYVVEVSEVSSVNLDFRLDIFLRLRWTDDRLVIPTRLLPSDYILLSSQYAERLWQPVPYFVNAKQVTVMKLTEKLSAISLYKNKTVDHQIRLFLVLGCNMEFHRYPMDIQECSLVIETFSHDSDVVLVQWDNVSEPVILNPDLALPQFRILTPVRTENRIIGRYLRPGNYSQVRCWFVFERYIGYHLIQIYFPSFLIVTMSWFSFYMGLDAIPGRVTLLVTSFLALITMFTSVRDDIPAVSYIKAIDVWMATCLLFHFSAIAEFIVIKYVDYIGKRNKVSAKIELMDRKKTTAVYATETSKTHQVQCKHPLSMPLQGNAWKSILSREKFVLKAEDASKFWFPFMFCLFVTIYFPLLLYRAF